MGLGRNASEEFFEEIIAGLAYSYVTPWIRKKVDAWFPDAVDEHGRSQPNILKDAVESSINVIVMGVMFLIIRYEEQFLEKLFILARSAKVSILGFGRDALNSAKNKIKSLRGVKATNRFNSFGRDMTTRTAYAQIVDNEARNIIAARHLQYASTLSYMPAAQMYDSSVSREGIVANRGAEQAKVMLQLATFKLFSGGFTSSDKTVLKSIYKTIDPTGNFDPNKVDVDKLNQISSFMFATDDAGHVVGLSAAFLDLLNGLGYLHKSNSGASNG
ncbi:MAG: hypothetical protein PHE67_05740 [Campylobacterales bacterium]|nr:hypothetical protein [Campylobacterales bacterium]